MLKTIFQIVRKDLKLFAADRRALILSFFVPIAIASFMGSLMDGMNSPGKPKPIPLLFVDNDHSEVSAKVLANLKATPSLAMSESDEAAARKSIRSGDSGVAVVVPQGFGAQASGGSKPALEILMDPSQAIQAQAVRGSVTQAAAGAIMAGGALDLPFTLKQTTEAAPQTARWSGVAHAFAGMGVQGLLFWSIELAMGLMRERSKGLWRRVRSAPAPMWMHVIARAISSTIRAMLIIVAVFGFGGLVFHIPFNGSLLGLAMVWICASVMAATFGLFVAALGKTEQQSRGLAVLVVLTMTMLGGAWFPSFLMPKWVQVASYFVPSKHAVEGFDAMTWRSQPWTVAVVPSLALLGFATVFLAVSLRRFTLDADPA